MTLEDLIARSEPMPESGGVIEGSSPLTAPLGLHSLLIRESVQNSWDARDDDRADRPVTFRIDAWDLDGGSLQNLRSLMPVDHLAGFERSESEDRGIVHPADSLAGHSVRVLVVSDRDTVGLCGPTSSGTAWEPIRHGRPLKRGQPRFANFVRNQGRAKADTGHGEGGAFGIGKSVLWLASRCGTILTHSRTTDADGAPIERFIGVVHGNYFTSEKRAYTGRHFIGRADPKTPDLVQPITGAAAAEARRRLPIPSYEVGGEPVSGTSIVVVDPRFTDDWNTELLRLRDAIRWQVWPKLVAGVRVPSAGPDMAVELRWNNNVVEVPDPTEDPEIAPYATTLLDCARDRSVTADEAARDHDIECRRPKRHLGTLKFRTAGSADENAFHLTLEPPGTDGDDGTDDDAVSHADPVIPFTSPWGQIALVRREPLLLVRYEPIATRGSVPRDDAAVEVGVFLSASDDVVEAALTRAEPPAHDDWISEQIRPEGPQDRSKTFVKVTMQRIRDARARFLKHLGGSRPGHVGGPEQEFSSRISKQLLADHGGLGGRGRPNRKKPPGDRGGRSTRPSVALRLVTSRVQGANVVHELALAPVSVPLGDGSVVLRAGGRAHDDTGSMPLTSAEHYRWTRPSGEVVEGPEISTEVEAIPDLALEVELTRDVRFRPHVEVQTAAAIGADD